MSSHATVAERVSSDSTPDCQLRRAAYSIGYFLRRESWLAMRQRKSGLFTR